MATPSSSNPLLNLPTLAAIASHGSFSKAADALDLNRAAISKRIAQMESALGVPVLARTTRKVQLTLAGKALLSSHLEAETLLNMAVDEARGTMLAMGGTVRITCANSSLSVHLIGPALFAFAYANPGIQVDLGAILDEPTASAVDIELRITDAPPKDRSARLLTGQCQVFLGRHSDPLQRHIISAVCLNHFLEARHQIANRKKCGKPRA